MAAQSDEADEKAGGVVMNEPLQKATLKLKDGTAIPAIGLCTFLMARTLRALGQKDQQILDEQKKQLDEKEEKQVADAVTLAIRNGYRYIDTAQVYRTEHVVGNVLSALVASSVVSRKEVFVKTKLSGSVSKADEIRQAIENSLKHLQSDYIDLMLIHSPRTQSAAGKRGQDVIERYKILHEYKTQGKIRNVGVTDFNVKHLQILEKACPDLPLPSVNLLEYTPFCQETEIMAYCEQRGILVESYCPIDYAKAECETMPC